MRESYRENLASSSGHEPYAGSSNAPGVAWASGDAGQPLSSEIKVPVCRPCTDKGKATSSSASRQAEDGHGGVVEPEQEETGSGRDGVSPRTVTFDGNFSGQPSYGNAAEAYIQETGSVKAPG